MTQANPNEADFEQLTTNAVRYVYLFVRQATPTALLDSDEWVSALRTWVVAHPNHELKVIVEDERTASEQLRALTQLCQRLTSKISVRAIGDLPPSYELPVSFICNDQGDAVEYISPKDDQVRIITNQRALCRSLVDDFHSISRYSQRSKYFVPLSI